MRSPLLAREPCVTHVEPWHMLQTSFELPTTTLYSRCLKVPSISAGDLVAVRVFARHVTRLSFEGPFPNSLQATRLM